MGRNDKSMYNGTMERLWIDIAHDYMLKKNNITIVELVTCVKCRYHCAYEYMYI